MHILVTGGTGFIGTALCARLLGNGHSLVVISRRPERVMDGIRGIQSLSEIEDEESFTAVINLAGEPIADKRWSGRQKQRILESRLETTQRLIDYFERVNTRPECFISGSAIGFYGVGRDDEDVDEQGLGDESFSSRLCGEWEAVARQAETLGIRTCLLRTGIVLGKGGGALAKMLPALRLGFGGKIGTGEQWMPWIHIDDLIGIIQYCLENEHLSGPVNGTAPNPVSNADFTRTLGQALRRPTFMSIPAFVVKRLMGQMGTELLLAGKRVVPAKLLKLGYRFRYSQLDQALRDLL